ncbi:hypothetical protein KM043_016936 [Ampulex compressa]|nr:hypothetical protein KM043_016936 [Ampulex compressa]
MPYWEACSSVALLGELSVGSRDCCTRGGIWSGVRYHRSVATCRWTNWAEQRSKWHERKPNVLAGSMVLLRSPAPPACWPLRTIAERHPGPDGAVRVVTARTAGGVLRRPTTGLCLLPVPTDEASGGGESSQASSEQE